MHTTKKSIPTNDHAAKFNLLTHLDFDSVSSNMTWVYFSIAKFQPFFLLFYLNFDVFSALLDEYLSTEI